jgi:ABC-type Mn2+/Zn2+ transport system ATPase subunit
MNRLAVSLRSIQHIASLTFEVDLTTHGLICLVGRNGVGKTTLVRALRNLSNADTFLKTASPRAFTDASEITYELDGQTITFSYDPALRSLNCKADIPKQARQLISAELSIPHGARFHYFQSASEADLDIRKAIALRSYNHPEELIDFLAAVYDSDKYASMAEVRVKGKNYYAIVKEDGTYIREDYLSSGEYFLVNLYRAIKGSAKLIVIDEIDLSLDAAAQAKLTAWLRAFCNRYQCKVVFTTHSLAVMQTLYEGELFYVEGLDGHLSITEASYSYVKARLFGFTGWDRYILTEDEVLLGFIEAIISKYCPDLFFSHKIIFVGGGSQVVSLMKHNENGNFLAPPDQVISILDGDQRDQVFASFPRVHLIPIDSVEKAIYAGRRADTNFPFVTSRTNFGGAKEFYNHLWQTRVASQSQIYQYLMMKNAEALQPLVQSLRSFLYNPGREG